MAQRVIEVKEHTVELSNGESLEEPDRCRMRVQASPVDVLLPSALEVHPQGLQLRPAPNSWAGSLLPAQPSTSVLQLCFCSLSSALLGF